MSYAFNSPPKVAPTELEPGHGLMPKRTITAAQALEALDELEASARGDEPFNHFAAPLVRRFIEQTMISSVAPLEEARNARRYEWLRQQHWNEAPLCVVVQPKQAVKLGHDCPALDRLDVAIDEAMTAAGVLVDGKEHGNGA